MENLEYIISLAGTILGFSVTLITLILKFVKNKKIKQKALQLLEIANEVTHFIEEAEKHLNYTGEEKRDYVLTKANQFAIDNDIDFDRTEVLKQIEGLVTLTKNVNTGKTEKKTWLEE